MILDEQERLILLTLVRKNLDEVHPSKRTRATLELLEGLKEKFQ